MIPRLGSSPSAPFPHPTLALDDPDGLLAWGGDLSVPRLLRAYSEGIFPWFSGAEPILWWSPALRCVLPTDGLHISRRLGRTVRRGKFHITADLAFQAVLEGCALSRDSTWITEDMKIAYHQLHEQGYAHSIEAWEDEQLVGGLYGVAIGSMFFGESMYSASRDASKVILVHLCAALNDWDMPWLDCQVTNPHLESLGAIMIPRDNFLTEVKSLVSNAEINPIWTQRFRDRPQPWRRP